jgi:DNA repair exonuclease SbcCD nuclease subunit
LRVIKLDTELLRFVFTTDWHLTDQPPGRRTKGYREQVMTKIEFVRDLTVKLQAVGLMGGDVFHAKSAEAQGNSFSLMNRLVSVLYGFYLGRVFGTHGNHDLWMDRVETLPHQPFGTLTAAGAIDDLSVESVIFENRDGSSRVQVDAYPYTSNDLFALDRVLSAPPREPGVTHRIVLMHQYGNPGMDPTMHGHPTIGFDRMADCDYDFALWGHDHSRTETVKVGNCTHVRLGSLARAALAEDQVDRPIAAAVLSFKGLKVGFKEVEVPTQPLEIAFTTGDKSISKVNDSAEVLAFKNEIAETNETTSFLNEMDIAVGDIEVSDPLEVMQRLCPENEKDILDLAIECMQR